MGGVWKVYKASNSKTIENSKIKNAYSRKFFKLKPDELAFLIEVFKKIDLRKIKAF